jgi:hypothetical protein
MAGQMMEGHCTNTEMRMYLAALQFQSVLIGFKLKLDIESKKQWLDEQVRMMNEANPGWWLRV